MNKERKARGNEVRGKGLGLSRALEVMVELWLFSEIDRYSAKPHGLTLST